MRKFVNLDTKSKKIIKNFLVFFGMVFGMIVVLIIFSLSARNSWRAGLAVEVQNVLDSYPYGQYTVGTNLPVNSTLSTSSAVYKLIKKDDRKNEKYYGVIVRIPSMLGPLPAVFIYSENNGVFFAGYAVDNGKASATVGKRISSGILKYWENMVPKIVANTGAE